MSKTDALFQSLVDYERETAMLRSIEALLGWDERTGLPTRAGEYRAEQIAYLAGLVHRRSTAAHYGEMLDELSAVHESQPIHDLAPALRDQAVTIRELKKDFDKQVKLPASLVEEMTRQSVLGQQVWDEARKHSDFGRFKQVLQRIIELKRQQAAAIGYEDSIYDPLLDDYEPGEKTTRVAEILAQLRTSLVPIVEQIANSQQRPNVSILLREFPIDQQRKLGRLAAERIGFNFDRGRLDTTSHPFCTELGPHDVRILTRYNESFFNESFFGTLHEAGHGIYEQGLRSDWYGLPPGKFASLGIHESQSRLWENIVGRSQAFWEHFYPETQRAFSTSLSDVTAMQFFGAVNDVQPSLIRVEADEATYNLHIIIRFELEQALISDNLSVDDLPDAWNQQYQENLGITPPNDAQGVLQDVHWSAGLFGYFPTYSLGNVYGAQLALAAEAQLGDLNEQFRSGDFTTLRTWLTKHIYEAGQTLAPSDLIQQVSGKPLSHQPLIDYLQQKLSPLYGL